METTEGYTKGKLDSDWIEHVIRMSKVKPETSSWAKLLAWGEFDIIRGEKSADIHIGFDAAKKAAQEFWGKDRQTYYTPERIKSLGYHAYENNCDVCDGWRTLDWLKDNNGVVLANGIFRCHGCGGTGIKGDPILRQLKNSPEYKQLVKGVEDRPSLMSLSEETRIEKKERGAKAKAEGRVCQKCRGDGEYTDWWETDANSKPIYSTIECLRCSGTGGDCSLTDDKKSVTPQELEAIERDIRIRREADALTQVPPIGVPASSGICLKCEGSGRIGASFFACNACFGSGKPTVVPGDRSCPKCHKPTLTGAPKDMVGSLGLFCTECGGV